MPEDNVTPIGARLGTERLYDEYDIPAEQTYEEFKERVRGEPKPPTPPPQPRLERRVVAKLADLNWPNITSNALELAGITAITAGSWLIRAWLGLIVLGLCLILLGVATGIQRSE